MRGNYLVSLLITTFFFTYHLRFYFNYQHLIESWAVLAKNLPAEILRVVIATVIKSFQN